MILYTEMDRVTINVEMRKEFCTCYYHIYDELIQFILYQSTPFLMSHTAVKNNSILDMIMFQKE